MPEPMDDFDDMRRYSNAVRLQSERRVDALSDQLLAGELTLAQWESAMMDEITDQHIQQFITGRGGNVTKGDLIRFRAKSLYKETRKQFGFLHKFAQVIEAAAAEGKSLNFVRERSRLYMRSSQAMFWHTAVPVDLPQVPRDGKTRCKMNCKCRLKIEYQRSTDGRGKIIAVLVTWLLRPAEHCPDCDRLRREWNPLRIEVDGAAEADMRQAIGLLLMDAVGAELPHELIYESWGMAA